MEPVSSAKLNIECHSWKGRNRTELVAVWGQPTGSKSDGQGGLTLEYRSLQVGSSINPDLIVPRSMDMDHNSALRGGADG